MGIESGSKALWGGKITICIYLYELKQSFWLYYQGELDDIFPVVGVIVFFSLEFESLILFVKSVPSVLGDESVVIALSDL